MNRLGPLALACALAAAVSTLSGTAEAAPAPVPVPAPAGSSGRPLALLQSAVRAERRLSFGGQLMATMALGTPAVSVFLRVVHLAGAGQLEQQPLLPGPAAPGDSDQAGPPRPAPLLLTAAAVALLAQHYRLVRTGQASVGGRSTEVVSALRSGGSAAGRFWLDRRTGLPVRVDLLAANGTPLVSSAFLQLAGHLSGPPPLPAANATAAATATATPATTADRTTTGAATQPGHLPATRAPAACRRLPSSLGSQMQLVDSRLLTWSQGRAVHLTYSDGLFTLSLFCQPGALDTGRLGTWTRRRIGRATVWSRDGTLRRAAWQSGGAVVTMVTDAPDPGEDAMLTGAVRQLVPPPRRHGLLVRLRRGLDRLGAWFDPFR